MNVFIVTTVPKTVLSDHPLGRVSPDRKTCTAARRSVILEKVRITPW